VGAFYGTMVAMLALFIVSGGTVRFLGSAATRASSRLRRRIGRSRTLSAGHRVRRLVRSNDTGPQRRVSRIFGQGSFACAGYVVKLNLLERREERSHWKIANHEMVARGDSYPVVFADLTHTIRYMTERARFEYEEFAGTETSWIGRCSSVTMRNRATRFRAIVKEIRVSRWAEFLQVTARNQRVYMDPVRDETGGLVVISKVHLNQER